MHRPYLFTSESVTEGHPDKMADQVSDAVLDAILTKDKNAHCAIETLFKTGICIVAGEVSTSGWVDVPQIARTTIKEIGYNSSAQGFDGFTCGVMVAIEGQSKDIAIGVHARENKEQGAGDQGMMFGYACDDTPEFMPAPIAFAHRLTRRLAQARKDEDLTWLRPDGKSQVTIAYDKGLPSFIDTVVISTQHSPDVRHAEIQQGVMEEVIQKALPKDMLRSYTKFHINPTGQFVVGGPMGDTGLTGRKIIVDTYGGMGRHGGGAFSGKDPSKVDRSAAYMARCIAKNIVAAGLAAQCEVQLAYAIGVAQPVSVTVHTFGTARIKEGIIENAIKDLFPLKPAEIIAHLQLLRPIYRATAAYGHFGRSEPSFTWEKLDFVPELSRLLK